MTNKIRKFLITQPWNTSSTN